MTWIRVDPDEMAAAATTISGSSAEVDATAQAARAACLNCCAPAAVTAQIQAAISALTASLAGIASDLAVQSRDLSTRGSIAASDSLVTAASSAHGPGVTAPVTGFVGGSLVGGGSAFSISPSSGSLGGSTMTIGGSGAWGPTSTYVGGAALIGGGASMTLGGGNDFAGGASMTVGGQSDYSRMLDQFSSSPSALGALQAIQDSQNRSISIWLEPSRSSLIHDSGMYMSPDEYTRRGYRGLN